MIARIYYGLRHLWKMGSLTYAIDFITLRRLKDRKGQCHRCGRCCGTRKRCVFLGTDNLCVVYKTRDRDAPWCFKGCPYSPIGLSPGCGYYWEDSK